LKPTGTIGMTKKKELISDPKISKKMPIKTYLLKDFSDSMIEALEKVK
jgi:hypothetical protein